jgi:hypothetical protein
MALQSNTFFWDSKRLFIIMCPITREGSISPDGVNPLAFVAVHYFLIMMLAGFLSIIRSHLVLLIQSSPSVSLKEIP